MKVIGIGLNKTGTKTLKGLLERNGFRHQTYDIDAFNLYRNADLNALLDWVAKFDSFEDWPWPLIYREIDERFPGTKFVLTVRSTPEVWYRSLCKMAVRMGPLNDYEKHIYGYSMPQGRKQHHIDIYERHNREVRDYFAGRSDQFIEVCFGDKAQEEHLSEFLKIDTRPELLPKVNESYPVYAGDNLLRAHVARVRFQTMWKLKAIYRTVRRQLRGQTRNVHRDDSADSMQDSATP